jgi:3-oxoacyl-[acyl-carrier protein] reductase
VEESGRVFIVGNDDIELTSALAGFGGVVTGTVADVSVEADVERFVAEAGHALGRIDILINNAGIGRKAPFLDTSADAWDRTIAVNLRGMFLVAREVAREMTHAGHPGVIVNMASTNAMGGEEDFAAYNASKGGVLQLTRTMAVELAERGIRVNCLCPGFIDTPLNHALADEEAFREYERTQIPLGRRGTAEEVAAAYAFLASDEATFIHGAALVIDGGQTAAM